MGRVLFINKLHPLSVGGAEQYIYRLGGYLLEHGWEVGYVTPEPSQGEPVLPGEVYFRPSGRQGRGYLRDRAAFLFNAGRAVREALQEFQPDLVVDNASPVPTYPAYNWCLKYGTQIATAVHEIRGWGPNKYKDSLLLRYLQPFVEQTFRFFRGPFIVVGPSTKRRLAEMVPRARIYEIPNSITQECFEVDRRPTQRPTVVVISRLARVKNIRTLLMAWPAVLQAVPEAQLIIAGSGPEEAFLRHQAAAYRLTGVTFEGRVGESRKLELLREAWVFVLPTWYEGFGISIVEAMAAGVPVVVSDVPGVNDYAKDGYNCVMCNPGNPRSVAEGIIRLLREPRIREFVSRNARETAMRYSPGSVSKIAVTVFDELIRSGS